jgi:membrane protein DedA with SNARE-associated domain
MLLSARYGWMNAIIEFLAKYGYYVLFAAVFARQLCVPVPSFLFLVAAGALAAAGRLSLGAAIVLAVAGCMLADLVWYEAGRRWGDTVLHVIHSRRRAPNAADQKSKERFARYGPRVLVLTKFLMGLDAAAAPLAGMSNTSRFRFMLYDGVGATLWSCAYAGLGYLFSHDLNRAIAYADRVGGSFVVAAIVGVLVYAAYKLARWRRAVRDLRLARIAPANIQARFSRRLP